MAKTSAVQKNLKRIKLVKKFAKKRLVVLEGRDMGVLFPSADAKIFFKCSLKIAANRRFKEFQKTNNKLTLKEVEKAIKLRNLNDTKRKNSPLRIPNGAVIVDTTKLTKKEVFRKISKIVEDKIYLKYGRNFKTR